MLDSKENNFSFANQKEIISFAPGVKPSIYDNIKITLHAKPSFISKIDQQTNQNLLDEYQKLLDYSKLTLSQLQNQFLVIVDDMNKINTYNSISIKKLPQINLMIDDIMNKSYYFVFQILVDFSRSYYGHIEAMKICTKYGTYQIDCEDLLQFKDKINQIFSSIEVLKVSYKQQMEIISLYEKYDIKTIFNYDLYDAKQGDNSKNIFEYIQLKGLNQININKQMLELNWNKQIEIIKQFLSGNNQNPSYKRVLLKPSQEQQDILKNIINMPLEKHETLNKILKWRHQVSEVTDENQQFIISDQQVYKIITDMHNVGIKEKYKQNIKFLCEPNTKEYILRQQIKQQNMNVDIKTYIQPLLQCEGKSTSNTIKIQQNELNRSLKLEALVTKLVQEMPSQENSKNLDLKDILCSGMIDHKSLIRPEIEKVEPLRKKIYSDQVAFKFTKEYIKVINKRADRQQAAKQCDILLSYTSEQFSQEEVQEDNKIISLKSKLPASLTEILGDINSYRTEDIILPQSFDELVNQLVNQEAPSSKKQKKNKQEEFQNVDIEALDIFIKNLEYDK